MAMLSLARPKRVPSRRRIRALSIVLGGALRNEPCRPSALHYSLLSTPLSRRAVLMTSKGGCETMLDAEAVDSSAGGIFMYSRMALMSSRSSRNMFIISPKLISPEHITWTSSKKSAEHVLPCSAALARQDCPSLRRMRWSSVFLLQVTSSLQGWAYEWQHNRRSARGGGTGSGHRIGWNWKPQRTLLGDVVLGHDLDQAVVGQRVAQVLEQLRQLARPDAACASDPTCALSLHAASSRNPGGKEARWSIIRSNADIPPWWVDKARTGAGDACANGEPGGGAPHPCSLCPPT